MSWPSRCRQLNTAVTSLNFEGVGGLSSMTAVTGLNTALQLLAGWVQEKPPIAASAVSAYETAVSTMIPAEVSIANRTEQAADVGINPSVLGALTPAIVALDTEYFGEHWPHNAGAGASYGAALAALVAALAVPPPFAPLGASPAAPAAAAAAVAQAAGTTGMQAATQGTGQVTQMAGQAGGRTGVGRQRDELDDDAADAGRDGRHAAADGHVPGAHAGLPGPVEPAAVDDGLARRDVQRDEGRRRCDAGSRPRQGQCAGGGGAGMRRRGRWRRRRRRRCARRRV